MKKRERKESFFVLVVFFCVCVIASMALLAHYLSNFISADRDEIALVPAGTGTKEARNILPSYSTFPYYSIFPYFSDSNLISSVRNNSRIQRNSWSPGFAAYDEKKIWSTKTQVDIFSASYKNDQGILTVESENNDKVFAPGTGDSYTFWLKNTGNVPMDYTLEFEALFSPKNVKIPVKAKIKSYNGDWLLGEKDKWGDVLKLNNVEDRATLGVNQYAKYTLDWQWVFERGYDLYDTYLGNRAVNEDLSLTIIIKTVAEANTGVSIADNTSDSTSSIQSTRPDTANPISSTGQDKDDDLSSTSFITADQTPKTGDILDLAFYIILAVASILGIFLLLFERKKDRE